MSTKATPATVPRTSTSTISVLRLIDDMLHPEQWGHAIPPDLAPHLRAARNGLGYKHDRVYLAGPMSGIASYNIPAFAGAAAALRARGWDVFAPHENGLESNHTWYAHMRVDIAALTTCGRMALLPGWEKSRGAVLEHHIARMLGMHVRPVSNYLGELA